MTTVKTTYKGRTTEIDNLLAPPKVNVNKPIKSYKFGSLSLYYDGVHYFPTDIKPNNNPKNEKPFEIQGVFYRGKWKQDTFYITKEFKEFLELNK